MKDQLRKTLSDSRDICQLKMMIKFTKTEEELDFETHKKTCKQNLWKHLWNLWKWEMWSFLKEAVIARENNKYIETG